VVRRKAVYNAAWRLFRSYDLLVTPTLAQPPALHGALDYDDAGYTVESWIRTIMEYGPFTALFNIAGQPAISLPLAQSEIDVPIGVQLVAPYGREDLLFGVSSQLERVAPWAHRRPPVFAGA
jgi:amidase